MEMENTHSLLVLEHDRLVVEEAHGCYLLVLEWERLVTKLVKEA